ncbi:hypothetical protein acdb102_44090 [Acidothermaceae bacterium B102]|nr:hypothetical protein acdb102_44090 [Acidothermaceae bacterium B102]
MTEQPHEPPAVLLPLAVLLRAARHRADLSQRELAERAGISRGVVGDVESGRSNSPSVDVVLRLLAAAGCGLVAVGPDGEVLTARKYDDVRDRGYRAWPAHLDVRPVRNAGDWWFGFARPGGMPLPPYTTDGRSRRDVRRRRLALEEGNTPGEPSVGGEEDRDG